MEQTLVSPGQIPHTKDTLVHRTVYHTLAHRKYTYDFYPDMQACIELLKKNSLKYIDRDLWPTMTYSDISFMHWNWI